MRAEKLEFVELAADALGATSFDKCCVRKVEVFVQVVFVGNF